MVLAFLGVRFLHLSGLCMFWLAFPELLAEPYYLAYCFISRCRTRYLQFWNFGVVLESSRMKPSHNLVMIQ